jgi:trypsin
MLWALDQHRLSSIGGIAMRLGPLWPRLVFAAATTVLSILPASAQEEIRPAGRRIVGGEKTDIKDHPWQVALDIKINGKTYLCGGSLIADRWVLTAAHCFKRSTRPEEVRTKAGATNYVTDGVWSDVQMVVIHEGYDSTTQEHDIALVRLRHPPSGRVIPLAMASMNLTGGTPLEVTGWGATSEGGEASRILMRARVPYAENTTCNVTGAYDGRIKPGMMCAGHLDGGIDSCQGDSGGPLVWRTTDGPNLVGVVSWGEGCARKLKYGVYTRVSSYVDWIGNVVARGGN